MLALGSSPVCAAGVVVQCEGLTELFPSVMLWCCNRTDVLDGDGQLVCRICLAK